MALTRWTPFATLPSLFATWEPFATPAGHAPVDVERTDGGYRVRASVPGFAPEDVEVSLDHGTLTITGKRSEEKESGQGRYLRREVFRGSFQRRFVLPREVTAEDLKATLENGVLTVEIAHAPENGAVKIPVGTAALPEKSEQPEQPAA